MAKDQTRRMRPAQIEEAKAVVAALQKIANYTSSNPKFSLASAIAAVTAMNNSQAAETQAEAALMSARDKANSDEWALWDITLGIKNQVIAQFGEDSLELQALGYKRKSEYKSPKRPVK